MNNLNIIGLVDKILDKEKASKFGQMAQCTKGGGKITKPMERAD